MSLLHLHNEIVSHRELASESWTVYLSLYVEESTGTIQADTFQVYYNAQRPQESWKQRIGQQRIPYNKAPFSVGRELQMLDDIVPAQPRDTVSFSPSSPSQRTLGPASLPIAAQLA